jgi:2-polyprenyl-3-methyl-5-hydroxy-6-metoxy-1,4-benzoquinol methylase
MASIDAQSEYWDKAAKSKRFTHTIEMEKLSPYLLPHSGILDYGCGYGRTCNELYQQGHKDILGTDLSQKMIDRGLQEYPHLTLVPLSDVLQNERQFDVIILFAVLTCLPSNDGQTSLIKQLYKKLSVNGILYISDYWLQNDERNQNRYKKYEDKHQKYGVFELPEGAIVRHHSKEWISTLLNPFETKALYDCELPSMNGNTSSCFQNIGQKK